MNLLIEESQYHKIVILGNVPKDSTGKNFLNRSSSMLNKDAAEKLVEAYQEIKLQNLPFAVSKMFVSSREQHENHKSYISSDGRKKRNQNPVPPPGYTIYESGRGFKLYVPNTSKEEKLKIRKILNDHGWTQQKQKGIPGGAAPISDDAACEYEYWGDLYCFMKNHGYRKAIKKAIKDSGNIMCKTLLRKDIRLKKIILKFMGFYSGTINNEEDEELTESIEKFFSVNGLSSQLPKMTEEKIWKELGKSSAEGLKKNSVRFKAVPMLLMHIGINKTIDQGLIKIAEEFSARPTPDEGLKCLYKSLRHL